MKGKVHKINKARAMAAILTANAYSIIEFSSPDDFKLNDEVEWSVDDVLGNSKIRNLTENRVQDVYFQNHNITEKNLLSLLRL